MPFCNSYELLQPVEGQREKMEMTMVRMKHVSACKGFILYKRYLKPVLHQAEYDPIYRRLYDANAVTSTKEVLLM